MAASAADSPASDIAGVLERMGALDAALDPTDGVAHFNRLHFRVTEAVLEAMREATFRDALWLEHLVVVFANLFFEAVRADARGTAVPRGLGAAVRGSRARRLAPDPVRARGG